MQENKKKQIKMIDFRNYKVTNYKIIKQEL